MALYQDLNELKAELDIDPGDTSEDKKLNFLLTIASSWIEELLGRENIFYAVRTEYYSGTGTQRLLLRNRPVYTNPVPLVYLDEAGHYGQPPTAFDPITSSLVYGTDFVLELSEEGGTSRSGILVRLNDYWPKPFVRQAGLLTPFVGDSYGTIKIIYGGGYTVDNLPPIFRFACTMLIARMRMILPLGAELAGESYEDRSISVITSQKGQLTALIRPMIWGYRNWRW